MEANRLINTKPWALILGASSGFGEATALELAANGMNIFGVHLDRRETLPRVAGIQDRIRGLGREPLFFNSNAADDQKRAEVIEAIGARLGRSEPQGTVRVVFHSLAFGSLRPLVDAPETASRRQLELTADIMGHSLVYWVRDLLAAGWIGPGARIFAMTSEGGSKAVPNYGPVGAAKAILEAHIRQLAFELAPKGITANAILAGVTDTPALRQIPGHERMIEYAKGRNPHGRLTVPEDIARAVGALATEQTYWLTGNVLRVDGGESSTA